MSKQSLSKGTLGLKFMNRTIPPSTPSNQSTSTNPISTTTTTSTTPSNLNLNNKGKAPETTEQRESNDWNKPKHSSNNSRPTITHDSSFLSFPLLSNSFASTSSSSSNFSSSGYYNSMPLTSSAISGRRSFGGANIEIEKLNDPSSHPPPKEKDKEKDSKDGPSKSSLKKKQRELPISGRREDLSGGNKKVLKRLSAADEQHDQEKRRKVGGGGEKDGGWDLGKNEDQVSFNSNGSKEFRKPAGFEGVKKQPRQKRGDGGMMGDEHKWGKKGSVREWDQDKQAELGSEEEDQRVLDGMDSESESESESEGEDSDDEAAIREMLMSAKALDRKRDGGSGTNSNKQQKKETIEREMRRNEEGMMGERQGSGSKGGKKQGRGGGGAGGGKRGNTRR